MSRNFLSKKYSFIPLFAMLGVSAANADTVWVDWTTATLGTSGSAAGLIEGVGVSYSGQLLNGTVINGTSTLWNPSSTYVGGSVDTSPSVVGDILAINQSLGAINFSSPVTDPVIAFWSLGQPGNPASFVFNEAPTFQVGGPNSVYGGSSILVNGYSVSGIEGNGVVMFSGTFDSIAWTSTYENWYGITVGAVSPVPLPASVWLLSLGLFSLFRFGKSKKC